MNQVDKLLEDFPEESRQVLRAVWEALPVQQQQDLIGLLPVLPNQPGKLQKLFELSRDQLAMSFGTKHDVVIVGPANVGKSTLYNQLIRSKEDAAAVSPVPGTTRENQSADAGPFVIVDTPGADAVGEVGQSEREKALAAAAEADFLVIMFDAVQGIKLSEEELFESLLALGKPFIVVLNKVDLVGKEVDKVLAQAATNLKLSEDAIIPLVATRAKNIEQVVLAIVKAEPSLVAALGQGLPAYRWQLAWRLITGAASTSGLIALTPLPFLDFIPLAGVQISLILGIARIYNYEMNLRRWWEVVSVLGVGFLGRTLFYEVIKLGGPPAWVVSASVAGGTTVALGYAAILWFERGEKLSREGAKRVTKIVSDYLVESLKGFGKRKPGRKTLSERIREALEKSPMSGGMAQLEEQQGND
ncbi:MAG: GTPase [Candidatus Promineifilaceae bacterium]